jgi:toxin ParE1/3/4
MPTFILAPRAKADLKEIGRYTKKTWGIEQRNKYLFGVEKRFRWLVKNAQAGMHRPEIHDGYYSFPHEQHVIFYTQSDNQSINIIGIVGAGQNLEKYFL